jgi:hypothetical protein
VRSLKEFLDEQAGSKESRIAKATAKRDEWVNALGQLNARIKGWIDQADVQRVLRVEMVGYPIREEGIGDYDAPGLNIVLEPWTVEVKPIARFVAGPLAATGAIHVPRAFGRVDLTNGLEKYMIFRTAKELDGPWIIVKQDGYRMSEFDQQSFEAALQSLFE